MKKSGSQSKIGAQRLATAGLMAALVVIGTMIIQIPTPGKGYIHLGDTLVYLCGIVLGPLLGAMAAAVGSMMADLFSGYGVYAPASFLIKGLDAWLVGFLFVKFIRLNDPLMKRVASFLIAVQFGGTVMVLGYLAVETVLYGFPTAVLSVFANIIQAIAGGLLAIPLFIALNKFIRK